MSKSSRFQQVVDPQELLLPQCIWQLASNTITRTQRDVAMAAGVTEVTIRNRYKEICEVLGMDAENPQSPN